MPNNNLARNKVSASTQRYLDIAEIKKDTVLIRDGSLRSVILVSSINFSLKSEDEQNAIISAYVSFLNNIDFPLQIVIQSRELNIENYLNDLLIKEKEQTNELLKMQTTEYIRYLEELIALGKIMNKHFYIIISYSPIISDRKNFLSFFIEVFNPNRIIKLKEEKFLQSRAKLNRRVENVISGLASIGLNAVELDTQSLIELYYNTYNPTTSANQKMVDIKKMRFKN